MVRIESVASSSKGNSYFITDGETPLLLEAGIRFDLIRKAVKSFGLRLSNVGGVIVSHEHMDHFRAVPDLMKAAIDCYMSAGTASKKKVDGHRVHRVQAGRQFRIGTWLIKPFETVHDAEEPLGYVLASGDVKLMFATDTACLPGQFQGLTHIMVECNYCEEVLERNVEGGYISPHMKRRLLFSHFGLGNVVKFLKETDTSKLREIHLLHASGGNSDVALIKRTVQGVTGVATYIAGE